MLPGIVKKRRDLEVQLDWKQCDLADIISRILDYNNDASLFDLSDLPGVMNTADLGWIPLPT